MMQDNSFEKNIGQELHRLNIEPSEKVWIAVEKELDNGKRRFRPGWWLFLVLLTIGSGGIWWMQQADNKPAIKTSERSASVMAEQKQVAVTTSANDVVKIDPDPSNTPVITSDRTNTKQVTASTHATGSPARASTQVTAAAATEDLVNNSRKNFQPLAGRQNITITSPGVYSMEEAGNTTTNSISDETTTDEDSSVSVLIADSVKTFVLQTKTRDTLQTLTDTAAQVASPVKNKKKNLWVTELSVAGGASSFTNLTLAAEKNEFMNADPGTVIPTPGNPVRERNEYKFKQGVFFQAGINIGRPLSKKITWLTGLLYSYQSLNIDRKFYLDSFTNVGTSGSYSNISTSFYKESVHIHSIQVPLLLKFTLSRHANINTGLYNNIIISSNSNKYADLLGRQKIYQALFHFNPSFVAKKFSIGPFINVGLKKYENGKHLMNYGLQLKYAPKK